MAREEPDTNSLTPGQLLGYMRERALLSRRDLVSAIACRNDLKRIGVALIGHWETGSRTPKRKYLIALIEIFVTRETKEIRSNKSHTRYVTRERANQLLKAFKEPRIDGDELKSEVFAEWIVDEEKNSKRDAIIEMVSDIIDDPKFTNEDIARALRKLALEIEARPVKPRKIRGEFN